MDREKLFEKFSDAKQRASVRMDDDPYKMPAYRFWFIIKNSTPVCCFEITGSLWTVKGKHYDLMKLYRKHRRLWPIIFETMGEHLE